VNNPAIFISCAYLCRTIFAAGCVSILAIASLPAHGEDLVGYNAKETCKSAIEAETVRGSRLIESPGPPNPVTKDFYGTIVFERVHHGDTVKVVYLCHGTKVSGGSIVAQLIYVDRWSEDAARSKFEEEKQSLQDRFGAPCWDTSRLNNAQREALRTQGKREQQLSPRTIWNSGPGILIDLSWDAAPNATPAKWTIVVHTHAPYDLSMVAEPFASLYRLSTCQRVASPSTSAPAR
jgi:hypothetical protein